MLTHTVLLALRKDSKEGSLNNTYYNIRKHPFET